MELEEIKCLVDQAKDATEEEKERGREIAFRFTFRRLANSQKKAFKPQLNKTNLWATSGVD